MFLTSIINGAIIITAVLIHYETLNFLDKLFPKMTITHRFRLAIGVIGVMTAHVIEIWLFAGGYCLMILNGSFGHLSGNLEGTLLDCVYFSMVNFTTLGFGDIIPHGNLRFLAGLEALTGLVLITWSASFLFLEMQRFWRNK